jgi:hypothetical protein
MALLPPVTAGCGKPFNEQIDLVGVKPLPALSEAGGATELRGGTSLSHGFDRGDWPDLTVAVPTKQVAHYATYVAPFSWRGDTGPWTPDYPTPTGALVAPTNGAADTADAVAQPAWAAGLLLWAPIDMVLGDWPWVEHRSPQRDYQLLPAHTPLALNAWFDAPAKPIWTPAGEAAAPAEAPLRDPASSPDPAAPATPRTAPSPAPD